MFAGTACVAGIILIGYGTFFRTTARRAHECRLKEHNGGKRAEERKRHHSPYSTFRARSTSHRLPNAVAVVSALAKAA